MGHVCVVGGGVVGLTTAVAIQQQNPNYQVRSFECCQWFTALIFQVRILSEKWSPDTTSDVAAGIFLWGPPAPDPETDSMWAEESWR